MRRGYSVCTEYIVCKEIGWVLTAKILHAEYHIEYRFLGEVCLGSAHGFRLLPNIAVFDLTGSFLEGLPLKSCSSNHNPKYGAHASFSSSRALLPTHQKKKKGKKGLIRGQVVPNGVYEWIAVVG